MAYNPNNVNGSATSTNSAPVVIASDQSSVGTIGTTATASADVTMQSAAVAIGNGTIISTVGYGTTILHVSGTFVGTVVFEASPDSGTTWTAALATIMGASDVATQTTTTGVFRLAVTGVTQARARISAYTSGSITVVGRNTNAMMANKIVRLASGTNTIGTVNVAGTVPVSGTVAVTGVATETTLAALNTKVTAVNTGAVVVSSSALPTGAATSAGQLANNHNVVVTSAPTTAVTGPLTDTQLRATPVPISGTVTSTPSGTQTVTGTVTANIGTSGSLALDATLTGGTTKAIARGGAKGTAVAADITSNPISANAQLLHVDGSLVTQPVSLATAPTTPVTGTFFQATQPVSLATAPSTPVTNAGTFAVQAAATLAAETTKVIGTVNIAAAQTLATVTAVTAITNALPTGANVIGALSANQSINNAQVGGVAIATGSGVTGTGVQRVTLATDVALPTGANTIGVVGQIPATLIVSTTGVAAAAVTLTIPAVASQFHYITRVNIVKYASVATVGAAAATIVTSTNLPGSIAWTTPTALPIGTQYESDIEPTSPIKSSVVNTATTIVCPATTGIIWRVNVYYYTAA